MIDPESKISLIAYQIEIVARIAIAIPNDHLARLYGRSVFLGIDSFLSLAPRLKNQMQIAGALTATEANEIKEKINKLRSDYEGCYDKIRDKIAAHQQDLDLILLLEMWNEIDIATLSILADDVSEIWSRLQSFGAVSSFARPPELDDEKVLSCFSSLVANDPITLSLDRVAATRPKTVGIIPLGLFQEKTMRVITAFDAFQYFISSGLEEMTSKWLLPEKACIDLFIVDACSVIDNLFEDRNATKHVSAEDSLVKIWKTQNVQGIQTLEGFSRDVALEQKTRELRNKFSAHVDPDIPFDDLMEMLVHFPLQDLNSYMQRVHQAFLTVCKEDIRTRIFLSHGQEIRGVIDVADTGAIKSFR